MVPDQATETSEHTDRLAAVDAAADPALPLAVRMRPSRVEELLGQQHLLAPGSPLRRLVEARPGASRVGPSSVVLWGPPGVGKTSIAHLVASVPGRRYRELSAVTAGVKDVRAVLDDARHARDGLEQAETVLFLDEIHRFSRSQQDALLPAVENRLVVLVAATTENPSFSVVSPLLSRSLVLTLRPLSDADVEGLVDRAVTDPRGLGGAVSLEEEARAHLVRLAGGDARRALTVLEAAAGAALARTEGAAGGPSTGGATSPDGAGARTRPAARPGRPRRRHPRRRRGGRRRGRGPLRPRGRPALRRGQRPHQVGAGQRRGRGAALPGPDARGRARTRASSPAGS